MPKAPDPAVVASAALLAQPGGSALRSASMIGAVVGERYRLEAPLGRGGMGIVYAAVHLHTRRQVAIKLIHCTWDEETLALYQRFLGEARAASAVRHRNVVDVLDMGYHGDAPYLVMERLAGESLEELIDRLELLPLNVALDWLLPVMGALAALHEKGIVHRDVKPSNIFLSRDPVGRVVPKLLDFGLARSASEAPLTEPGIMLGTPQYMAPERARGDQQVGPWADVWAMGVVLFECLCGKLPYTATSLNGVAAQIISGEVLKAQQAKPDLPEVLAAVIDRALRFEPDERHRDMASFAYALGAAAQQCGATLPLDPDPVGLPNFASLHVRGGAWASGPLVSLMPRVDADERLDPHATTARTTPRRGLARALRWSVAGLMVLAGAFAGSRWQRAHVAAPVPAPPALALPAPKTVPALDGSPTALPRNTTAVGVPSVEALPSAPPPTATRRRNGLEEPANARPTRSADTGRANKDTATSKPARARTPRHDAPRRAGEYDGREFEKEWM